jgi:hypothetical protein
MLHVTNESSGSLRNTLYTKLEDASRKFVAAKTNLLDRQRNVIDSSLESTSLHHTAYE